MKMKKLRPTFKELGSRERRKLNQLDAGGVDQFAKLKLEEDHYRKRFRSNLSKIVAFVDKLNLKASHIDCLRRTPFYNFLEPFINKRVSTNDIKGTQKGLVGILMAYNRNEKAFVMGGHKLTISPKEFELVFGIPSGHKEIEIIPCPVFESSLGRRRFADQKKVTAVSLRAKLEKCVKGKTKMDIEDTVRILILHIVGCVFFVASSDVARGWMFKLCDNLDDLRNYNWAQSVVGYLVNYLDCKDVKDVRGCTVFLQYWFCERTTLVQPKHEDAFPRFLRWDLQQMRAAFEFMAVKDLGARQVRGRPITATEVELQKLSIARDSPAKKIKASASTSRSKTKSAMAPSENELEDAEVELGVGFTAPLVQKNAESEFDIDNVPIAKLDFSNMSKPEEQQQSTHSAETASMKGKTVMSYERELEEREEKLSIAEKVLQKREHAVDIRLEKLEERMLEAAKEAERWKSRCAEQEEIIKKLVVEAQLNAWKQLEPQLTEEVRDVPEEPILHSYSPNPLHNVNSLVMLHEPSFSLELTQTDEEVVEGVAMEQIANSDADNNVPTSIVAKRTWASQVEVSPPPKSALGKLGKHLDKYGPFKELSNEHQVTVESLAGMDDLKGCILWWDKERQIRIKHSDLLACIQRQCLSSDVIDAYCRILHMDQEKGLCERESANRLRGTTHVFDSLLLSEIRMSETGTFILPADQSRHRYLMFPIHHKQDNSKRGVDHWTVLVMDKDLGELRWYNSLRPRRGTVDPYLVEANELKKAIVRTAQEYGIPLPLDRPIIEDENAPQQDSTSVDCGVAVLLVITKYYEQQPVVKKVGQPGFVSMRAKIVETLLGWSKGKKYFVDQLRKKRRVTS